MAVKYLARVHMGDLGTRWVKWSGNGDATTTDDITQALVMTAQELEVVRDIYKAPVEAVEVVVLG